MRVSRAGGEAEGARRRREGRGEAKADCQTAVLPKRDQQPLRPFAFYARPETPPTIPTQDCEKDRNAPSRVVDDVLDNTTDVTVLLGEVESTESRGGLVQVRVRLEDTSGLSLVLDDTLREGKGGTVVRGRPREGTRALRARLTPMAATNTGRTEKAEVSKRYPQERTSDPSPQAAALEVQSSSFDPPRAYVLPAPLCQPGSAHPSLLLLPMWLLENWRCRR